MTWLLGGPAARQCGSAPSAWWDGFALKLLEEGKGGEERDPFPLQSVIQQLHMSLLLLSTGQSLLAELQVRLGMSFGGWSHTPLRLLLVEKREEGFLGLGLTLEQLLRLGIRGHYQSQGSPSSSFDFISGF